MNENFYIGQIFEGKYPPAAAIWCNANNAYIEKIAEHRYEIKAVPEPLLPTNEEQRQNRANAYAQEVDPITAHINRLKDEEQTEEIVAEIEALKAERSAKVQEIKESFPYYENEEQEPLTQE